jgi:hypothetical protein
MRRLSTLAGAAGFLLLLKVPAFAQSPVLTTSPPSSGNHDESQTLGDTAWWSQDDGSWGDDYEVYQLGWSPARSCRSWSSAELDGADCSAMVERRRHRRMVSGRIDVPVSV